MNCPPVVTLTYEYFPPDSLDPGLPFQWSILQTPNWSVLFAKSVSHHVISQWLPVVLWGEVQTPKRNLRENSVIQFQPTWELSLPLLPDTWRSALAGRTCSQFPELVLRSPTSCFDISHSLLYSLRSPNASSLSEFLYLSWCSLPLPPRSLLHHGLQWFHSGLNILGMQEQYHSFGSEFRLLWTFLFFYLFMLVLLLLWKEHGVHYQTDVGLNFRPVIGCAGQPLPSASCSFPVTWKWWYLPHRDAMRRQVKARCGAQHRADDYPHSCWFSGSCNSPWHIIGSSMAICWMVELLLITSNSYHVLVFSKSSKFLIGSFEK